MGFRELLHTVEIFRDVTLVAALATLAVGCWWIEPAAGLIVPSAIVLIAILRGAR